MTANVLSIAGTDPTGGAGIQADIKAFSAMKSYALAVVTAVVAQNTQGVRKVVPLDPSFVAEQLDAVFDDVHVDAVKIGMVANAGIAETIADRLHHHKAHNIVLDPVMVAKSGDRLLDPDAITAVRELLVPLATVITPNLPEASVLLGTATEWTLNQMRDRVSELHGLGCQWVLLKGGHLTDSLESVDLLHGPTGTTELSAPRLAIRNDHGTGCTLSAAIAALLPGCGVQCSTRIAKDYLYNALRTSEQLDVGHGHGPVHHFHQLWR